MKYNTISTTSLAKEERRSMLTNKKETDDNKMTDNHEDFQTIKNELELVQKALKTQTRRCRQLVTEYTRRLRLKEQQYHSEKTLREDQLAKVLRALLIFEARLRQEQKIISHQLEEKDAIIKKQSNHIKSILSSQYCKNCKQYYSSSPNLESLDSSSEYVTTDYQYHGYQSSNFESLDSSSEIYATISEKSYKNNVNSGDDNESKVETDSLKYQRDKDVERKTNKLPHRKSVGTYFEVLKMRNDDKSSCSNDDNDNTSNDYENLDSLPNEGVTGDITVVSERIKNIFQKSDEASHQSDSSLNLSVSDCRTGTGTTINETNKITMKDEGTNNENKQNEVEAEEGLLVPNKSENISNSMPVPVFEGDSETNEKWYVSTSDQEDEQQREIYRNNPVLECVNQILLQNMNDNLNSPPKTPATERKCLKNKKVKFSDEEDNKLLESSDEKSCKSQNYYETPIQKAPHHYETPQSIYSNDYEQILSKCSSDGIASVSVSPTKLKLQDNKYVNNLAPKLSLPKPKEAKEDPYYIDMINKEDNKKENNTNRVIRKKMLRTPPALPPKPANLISKHKITLENKLTRQSSIENLLESEPDYCSISELNLPLTAGKRISVIAEINPLDSNDVKSKLEKNKNESIYDPVISSNESSKLLVSKKMEKLNIQTAKQTTIKSEPVQIPMPVPVPVPVPVNLKSPKNKEPDIPKLPQVSEIIIPEETEEKDEEVINNDNYVKNNTQIKKTKPAPEPRRSIAIGSSVSSLITGFNNRQIINEVTRKPPQKLDSKLFSSFDNHQTFDTHHSSQQKFDDFDLSQNFEEFKLDDCEIEEYNVEMEDFGEEEMRLSEEKSLEPEKDGRDLSEDLEAPEAALTPTPSPAPVPVLSKNSIEFLKKQLQLQGNGSNSFNDKTFQESPKKANEPSYEHFLECTGLSSKSILTPSRLISNHKNMLKPKDVKLRSKVKANLMERHNLGTITTTKYWSEPYL